MSDYRGFFLDINASTLFGSETQHLPSLEFRDIQSKHSKSITTYITEKHAYLSDRRFFVRLQRMCDSNVPNPRLAQELDRELTRAGLSAGKKCRKLRKPQWSVKLTKARHKLSILKRVIGMVKLRKTFIIRSNNYRALAVWIFSSQITLTIAKLIFEQRSEKSGK